MLPAFLGQGRFVKVPVYDWVPQLSPEQVVWFAACWISTVLFFLLGLFARTSGMLLTLLAGYLILANQNLYSHHLHQLFLLCLLLTIADSGATLSLDWLRTGRRERLVYLWPQALIMIMIQISLVYGFAGLQKINAVFLSGGVLREVLRLPVALIHPAISQGLAGLTVAIELFISVGLWSSRLRPWACLSGFALHLSVSRLAGSVAPTVGLAQATRLRQQAGNPTTHWRTVESFVLRRNCAARWRSECRRV